MNFSWNLLGSLVYSLSQFLILMILAKLGNPVMVGLYSLGLAITAPIINLTNLQLRQIQATDTNKSGYQFNDYFGLRILAGLIMLFITYVIIIINNYDFEKTMIIFLVGLSKVFDSYSDVVYGQLQQRERMDYIGKSRIIKGVSTIIVVGALLYLTGDIITSLLALNITWILLFITYDKNKIKLFINDIKPKFNFEKLKKLTILAFPLGIVLMLGSLNTNLPRFFVEKYIDESALGYFASIAYFLVAGNIFIQSVGQAFSPRLAKLYRDKQFLKYKRNIRSLVLLGVVVGFIGFLISVFFGEFFLTLLYDSTYAQYNFILKLIMISGIFSFSASFLGHGITAMRLFRIQPITNLGVFIITLILSTILIPRIGLLGAAYTLIIANIFRFIFNLSVIYINLNLMHKTH